MVEAQVVDKDIPHPINLALLGALTVGDTTVTHTCCEKQVGKTIDDQSVHLFRHLDVETTCAGHQMR